MADVRLEVDIQDLVDKSKTILDLNAAQVASLKNWQVATVKWDETERTHIATLQASISETQKLTIEVKKEAGAWEFNKAKLTQMSDATLAAAKAKEALNQATREAAKQSRQDAKDAAEKAKQIDLVIKQQERQARLDAQLRQRQFKDANTQGNLSALTQVTATERARLQGLGVDLPADSQAKLSIVSRRIAELGTQAGVSSRQLLLLFAQVRRGDLSGIDSKYRQVVEAIVKYNSTLAAEQQKIARNTASVNVGSGGGGSFPAPTSETLRKTLEFGNILGRISGTLTNLALYRGFNTFQGGLTASISAAKGLETEVALIRTISQDSQVAARTLTKDIRDVSNASGFAAQEVATAFYDAVSNQSATAAGAKDFVIAASNLAKVTKSSVEDAGNLISTVANTYGQEAGTLEEISAKIFKTVDRGRVTTADLSQNLGRIISNARTLGISFDEVLAGLATLTRSGLSSSQSVIFLNNAFEKLVKPTEAASQLLQSFGATSGPAAIRTFGGLQGTILKLAEATEQGKITQAEFFDEIRGKAAFDTVTQNFRGFATDIEQISQKAKGSFQGALEIQADTAAARINKLSNLFQNTLTSSFGQAFNNVLIDTVGRFVDIDKNFKDINTEADKFEKFISRGFRIVGAFGGGVVAATIAVRGFAIVTELSAGAALRRALAEERVRQATISNIAPINAVAAAEQRLNLIRSGGAGGAVSSLARANPLGLAASVGVGVIGTYLAYKNSVFDDFNGAADAVSELGNRLRDEGIAKEVEKTAESARQVNKEFAGVSKTLSGQLADAIVRNDKSLRGVRDSIRVSQDSLKSGFAGAIKLASDRLDEMKRKFAEIPNLIRESKKSSENFADTVRNVVSGNVNKYASPQQRDGLLSGQIAETLQRAQKLFSTNDRDSIAEARRLFDDVARLLGERDQARTDLAKQQYEMELQQRLARGERLRPGEETYFYDATRIDRETVELKQQRNQLELQYQGYLEKQQKIQQEAVAKEEIRVKRMREAIEAFENFNLFEQSGGLKDLFKTETGRLDPKKVLDEFKRVSEDLKQFVPNDVLNRLNFGGEVKGRESLIQDEIRKTLLGDDLKRAQDDFIGAQKRVNDLTGQAAAKFKEYDDQVKQLAGDLKTLAGALGSSAPGFPADAQQGQLESRSGGASSRLLLGAVSDLGGFTLEALGGESNKFAAKFKEIGDKFAVLEKQFAEAPNKLIERNGRKIIDPDNLKNLKTQIDDLTVELAAEANKVLDETNKSAGQNRVTDDTRKKIESFQNILNGSLETLGALSGKVDAALGSLGQGENAFKQLDDQVGRLNKLMDASAKNYAGLNQAAASVVGGFGFELQKNSAQLEQFVGKLQEYIRSIEELKAQAGGEAATGGTPARRAYGGPIGKDNRMAWLQDEEYVMNGASTRRFYSKIVQLNNAGRTPQYFNSGGEVTNMGGVNINVSGAGNADAVGNNVYRKLQRARRMGRA